MQLQQEVFQNDESCVNQNAVEIQEYFEINDLKARLQDKDKTICKLKATIKSLRENTKEENVNPDKCDLEPINKELENSVANLLSENERLCNEINHVKQVFKDQFDSIKQTRVRHKEQSDSLINKLNLKSVENEDLKAQIQDKLDLESLPPRLLQNREVHITYLRNTQEQANILQEIVEQAKAKQPLDNLSCNAKKVTVKPMNNVKKVRFAEPLTSSSKIQQVESSNTSDSNTPVLSSTGVKCSTSNCRSKLPGNKKMTRTPTPSYPDYTLLDSGTTRLQGLWGKSKKSSHQPKAEDTNQEKLYLLHMDLCGPMRMASINGKSYILVIVDDYSRFTWVIFLKAKDEAPAAIIKCIKNIQVCLKATVRNVRTDNGTEFVNQTLREWYENVGITHQTSVARTLQQNGVVERQNQTLVEAARTMLIFSKAPLFLWAEAINTACYT
ncbi:retrovirus-related pol polyprotein from transposon TNT 1-94 [Tanacetum coccineum]